MPAVPPEHVQPVCPVRPARHVRSDHVGQRALRRDQREGQRGCGQPLGARRRRTAIRRGRRRGAVRRGDFCHGRDVQAVGDVLEPAADGEFGLAVDVVQVFQAVILRGRLGLWMRIVGAGVGVGGRGTRTRRMNRHGRAGRRRFGSETGIALRNHAPCMRQWMRC